MAVPEPEPEHGDAAAFFRDAPAGVILEIVRRLPARSLLRLRAVCGAWRDIASHPALLAVLHLLQRPQPLLCFCRAACPDRHIQLRDYCVEALDLRSDKLRSVLRFTDNEYRDYSENVDGDEVPPIQGARSDYGEEEEDEDEDLNLKPRVVVHASLDGLLLVSFINIWCVCNPATRQWASLPPELHFCDMLGLYEHVSSGEYRVLYHTGKDDEEAATCYYVLTVGYQVSRSIGCPVSPAATEDEGLDIGLDHATSSPPVQLRCNLHWPPQERQGYHILVFDTEAEVFSWMSPPVRDAAMRLLEMEGHKLGMSVSRMNKATLELWRLEDYHNEIWVLIYRIELAMAQMPALQYEDWFPSVVSPEGDVLIECQDRVLHCDRNGNLLQKFWFPEGAPFVRHALKESLVSHAIFRAPKGNDAIEPPFFRGL